MKFNYICSDCHKQFEITPQIMVCPECSKDQKPQEPLRGIIDVSLTGEIGPNFPISELLPVEKSYLPSITVGSTPFWKCSNLEKITNHNNIFIKDDGLNPTGSLKDRASYLVAAFAKANGIKEIALASTGNAGSSMAGIGANCQLKITLFLPKNAPIAKVAQAIQYGANVITVDGNYDDAYDLCLQYCQQNPNVLSRNTAHNPLTIEGKKTVSLEIFKQLKNKAPDYLFVSAGDGVILSGVYKGFYDLLNLGLIKDMPKIYAVQAQGSCALYNAYHNNGKFIKQSTSTVADSICVDVPRNGYRALKYLKKYNGSILTVTDDEILKAQKLLSETTGHFSEPAGAASFAGFLKTKKDIAVDKNIVLLTTGNGLKDIDASLKISKPLNKPIKNLNQL